MDNDKVGQVPPDNTEGLRERAEAAVEDWFNHLTDDDEPTIEQIGRGVAAAVLTALAGDPGDLPTRMRDAILDMPNPKLSIGDDDTHRHHRYAAGCPVCKGDVEAIAAAAMSVRWEYATRKEAELDAAEAFRLKFLGILFGLRDGFAHKSEAARIADEPEPTYTAEQILKWLDNMLDRSDKAAEKAKTKSLAEKQAEKQQEPKPPALDGQTDLFEVAS